MGFADHFVREELIEMVELLLFEGWLWRLWNNDVRGRGLSGFCCLGGGLLLLLDECLLGGDLFGSGRKGIDSDLFVGIPSECDLFHTELCAILKM